MTIIYTMSSSRVYKKCHKCGNNTIGRYTDSDGNYMCPSCTPHKLHKKTSPCIKCGGGHMGITDDGMCNKCRTRQLASSGVRKCPTCNKTMRTTLDEMDECVKCMGIAKYHRLLRANKKITV
jgi:hypothetical protein